MKILLIDPPYERLIGFKSEWFPLGLAYIASFLIERGYNEIGIYHTEHALNTEYKSIVRYAESFHNYKEIISSNAHPVWDEVRQTMSSFHPDVVGLSVLTAKVPSAFRIAKICKEVNPRIKVVCGGYHPTIRANEMLSTEQIDFVVRGEGEETLHELLRALQTDNPDYRDIDGLSFKEGRTIIHNKERVFIKELDIIPLPARERLLHIGTYSPAQLNMVMTSRGCPYDCGFCASCTMWKRMVRFRSVENTIDEVRELRNRYFVKNIAFMDDSFTLNHNRVKEFCRAMIENHMDITWSCLTRVNMISDEIIALMKKAGCTKVDVGIESGNQRVLNLIGKDITLEQVRDTVKILRRNKMYWSGFFMFGFPTETEDEAFDTLDFLKELKPDWANMSIFTPYPGTILYNLAKEKGIVSEPVDYTLYSHQNPYLRFTDTIPQEKFSSLASYILKEIHRYNSSYRSLVKRAFTRNYHKNPKLFLRDIKKVATWLKK